MTSVRLGGPSLPPASSPTGTAVAMPLPPPPPSSQEGARPQATRPNGGGPVLYADTFERAVPQAGTGAAAAKAAGKGGAGAVGPGSGTAIGARTRMLPGQGGVRVQYEFDRPLTHEQAAKVLFAGGTVPAGSKLVRGEGANTWVLHSPDMDTHQATMRRMNSRTEQADPNRPYEGTISWSGGPNVVSNGPPRRDLQNDYGFVVTKRFKLDEGQIPDRMVRALDGKGIGYEIAFERPMTEKQVMEKLFDQGKFQKGDVKLVPAGGPPAMVWRVQIAGPDALTSVKRPYDNAFSDASAYAPLAPNPAIPSGMRAHFDAKTVPRDAKHFPPGTYVWEQEGHIAYVRKDGKGGYTHEFTKLHPSEEKFNSTMRHFMIEKGMPPRQAWKAFSQHWDDINQQIVVAVIGGLSGGRMPGKAPGVKVTPPVPRRAPAPAPRTPARPPQVRTGDTLPGNPPPPPKVAGKPAGAGGATRTQPDHGTTLTADPGRARTRPGAPPAGGGARSGGGTTVDTGGKTVTGGGTVETGGGTVATTGPRPQGNAPRPWKPGEVIVGRKIDGPKRLPDGQRITIRTPKGPQNMTVGEYRKRHAQAEKWMSEQRQKYQATPGAQKGALPPNHEQLARQAQERFGLDQHWQSVGNPYIHGPL